MKVTDYAPRAAPFDSHLRGRDLVGVEIGVDVGAHAEALLTYCDVARLYLVDPWPNPYCRGYCDGRLQRFRPRFEMIPGASHVVARTMAGKSFDFVYIDQEHDAEAVAGDLRLWYPLLKPGGIMGYRNYVAERGAPLDKAIELFINASGGRIQAKVETGEIVMTKCR